MTTTLEKIQTILKREFTPTQLEIQDDTANHAGHVGSQSGGGHYKVLLVSAKFKEKSLIEQHRMVQEALKDLYGAEIHALALQTSS